MTFSNISKHFIRSRIKRLTLHISNGALQELYTPQQYDYKLWELNRMINNIQRIFYPSILILITVIELEEFSKRW